MNDINVSFLIPVIGGRLYLGRRNTEPHRGFYGPIGGKADLRSEKGLWLKPEYITKPGGSLALSMADKVALEYSGSAAVREFCEEMFANRRYPEDFKRGDIEEVVKLGFVDDSSASAPDKIFHCQFHIADVKRRDFSLSKRELSDFVPLAELADPDLKIYPIGKMALLHLKWVFEEGLSADKLEHYKKMELHKQIPDLNLDRFRFTSLHGAMDYMARQGLSFRIT